MCLVLFVVHDMSHPDPPSPVVHWHKLSEKKYSDDPLPYWRLRDDVGNRIKLVLE